MQDLNDDTLDVNRIIDYSLESKFLDAIATGNDFMFDQILRRIDFDPSFEGSRALIAVVMEQRWDYLQRLIQNPKMDPGLHANWLIGHCAFKGYEKAMKILLEDRRVDPTCDRNVCIRSASRNGHLGVVEQLLADSRVDASANDNRALQSSIFMFHLPIILRLINNKRVMRSLPVVGSKSAMQRQVNSIYVLGCTVSNTIQVARYQLARLVFDLIAKKVVEFCIGSTQLKLPSLLSFFIVELLCEPFSNCDISMHKFLVVIESLRSSNFF